ncbi:MAG TPA: DNA alkylation repair protein [Bryobacteraceae bacterium]|nr:DNA alkylation repair protein [Bryobacteraceae bacterium]
MTEQVRAGLRRLANPAKAAALQRFFKTGKGQYGEGDVFLGVMVPDQRRVARECSALGLDGAAELLASPIHEERLTALLILVNQFAKAAPPERKRIYDFYLRHRGRVNNWDLVDLSAPQIVGPCATLAVLEKLARSRTLWDRRIGMVATFYGIREGEPAAALRIAEILVEDEHDLIHKAAGWMLREVGKRCGAAPLEGFLDRHADHMPRTMLRYAIERMPEEQRRVYLGAGASARRVP